MTLVHAVGLWGVTVLTAAIAGVSIWTKPIFMAVHQVLDISMPSQDLGKLSDRIGEISQLHVVGPPQGPPFKGPDWITVQQQTRHCGLDGVDQAGERLDLPQSRKNNTLIQFAKTNSIWSDEISI